MKNQFLEIFFKEWELFQKQGGTLTIEERPLVKDYCDFDNPVKAGEIRVFAKSNRQLIGLVYKVWGENGWIIIPVSDFTIPATEQEILIGSRVYQLWNTFTVSTDYTKKSWLIDVLPQEDMQDICEALLHVMIGEPLREDLVMCLGEKITSIDDPRLEYERTFIANEQDWQCEEVAETSQKEEKKEENKSSFSQDELERTQDELKRIWSKYKLDSKPLAAATKAYTSPFIRDKQSWKGEGCDVSDFVGYYAGEEPTTIVFTLNTQNMQNKLDLIGQIVDAYVKKSDIILKVGTGNIYDDSGELKVDITVGEVDNTVNIEGIDDLVLILAE